MSNDHGWMWTNKWHSDLTQYWWIGVRQTTKKIIPFFEGVYSDPYCIRVTWRIDTIEWIPVSKRHIGWAELCELSWPSGKRTSFWLGTWRIWKRIQLNNVLNRRKMEDAKSTRSYFLGPTSISIIMSLSDLWWQFWS